MKKFLNLALIILAVLLMSSCSSTKVTTAVTTGQTTTTIAEPITETVVETAEPTTETVVETAESRLFEEEIIDTTESTTKAKTTTTTTKKQTTTTTTKDKRLETGNGKRLDFPKGVTVCGATIEINGKTFINCIIKDAPMNGVVVSGVIWPWKSEIKGLKLVNNDEILAPIPTTTTISPTTTTTTTTTTTATTTTPTTIETTATTIPTTTAATTPTTIAITTVALIRTPTGVGQSLTFQAGDTVVGWKIIINGKTFEGGVVIYNSPLEGTVTDGVINPWSTEITNQTVISIN